MPWARGENPETCARPAKGCRPSGRFWAPQRDRRASRTSRDPFRAWRAWMAIGVDEPPRGYGGAWCAHLCVWLRRTSVARLHDFCFCLDALAALRHISGHNVALACVSVACATVWIRFKTKALLKGQQPSLTEDALLKMIWACKVCWQPGTYSRVVCRVHLNLMSFL